MSSDQDLLDIANQAEKDLNSYEAKQGLNNKSASSMPVDYVFYRALPDV